MKWNKRYDEREIAQGKLIVFFNGSKNKFQAKDYKDFLNFIQKQQVRELEMSQMSFQDSCKALGAISFQQLMTGIFSTPSLTRISFGGGSSYAIHFSEKQCKIICNLLAQNQHITDLTLNVSLDNSKISTLIADMLRANNTLVRFTTNTTNDQHGYSILKAATNIPTLRSLNLPFTSMPMFPVSAQGSGGNSVIDVTFEGNKQSNTRLLIEGPVEVTPNIAFDPRATHWQMFKPNNKRTRPEDPLSEQREQNGPNKKPH